MSSLLYLWIKNWNILVPGWYTSYHKHDIFLRVNYLNHLMNCEYQDLWYSIQIRRFLHSVAIWLSLLIQSNETSYWSCVDGAEGLRISYNLCCISLKSGAWLKKSILSSSFEHALEYAVLKYSEVNVWSDHYFLQLTFHWTKLTLSLLL